MCLAMSYSIEILGCITVGLGLGHHFFNLKGGFVPNADPCCVDADFDYARISDVGQEGGGNNRLNEVGGYDSLIQDEQTPLSRRAGAAKAPSKV